MSRKKYTCFWCQKKFVDLTKHTKNMHPDLQARSYDYIAERVQKQVSTFLEFIENDAFNKEGDKDE